MNDDDDGEGPSGGLSFWSVLGMIFWALVGSGIVYVVMATR